MNAVLAGLLAGAFVGVVFGVVRLVPPAPPTWAGVAGIVAAWQLVGWLLGR